jgi:oligopeptide transport system permease protein
MLIMLLKFLFKRILVAVPTLFMVVLLVFLLVHLTPGNPFQGEKALSPEALRILMHQYRLDLPLWKQFIFYLNDLLHGDFGTSYKMLGQPISELLFPNNMGGFWVTIRLASYTMLISVPLGIFVGCYAGFMHDSWLDRVIIAFSVFFNAIPAIVIGPLLVFVFAVSLQLLPASGWNDGGLRYVILPLTTLCMAYAPTIAFVTRGSIIEVLNSSFIRTARAKGLPNHVIIFKHAIKPTILPIVSLLGPMFAGVFVGAVVTEQIFALPGLGVLTTEAATNRDYNLVLAITIFGSCLTILFNVVVDVIYFFLDSRVKQ